MILYRTKQGALVEHQDRYFPLDDDWDELVNRDDLSTYLQGACDASAPAGEVSLEAVIQTPLASQEIWAAGVTYFRSRTARMEESQAAGGSDFYDRVYHADRPELFLKATPHRAVGHRQTLHLRSDSQWIVPEPELTLAVTRRGTIVGYTIGNDLSCRDIEGENPLYLPQAKTFDACAAVGPGIYVTDQPLPGGTRIELTIERLGEPIFEGNTALDQLKKPPRQLVDYLYRDNSFPHGCLLMTGTGIVPPDGFSLQSGDTVHIRIDRIGTLTNSVA
ncbi:MAG: fumarylacetoacetate hydrolase family protein [Pirellulales bacterium]